MGYSSWAHKESDTTEQLTLHFHFLYNIIALNACALSCLVLCDAMDCNPPGFSVMVFSRQEYGSGEPISSPGLDLPNPAIKSTSPASPTLQTDSLPLSHLRKPYYFNSVQLLSRV